MNYDIFAAMLKQCRKWIIFVMLGGLLLSFYQCANIVAPKGGPKDERPPILDSLNSTSNYLTNYTKSPIVLSFDEWIVLKDAITQVVVSPPLEFPLSVKLKKKSVTVEFNEKEVLKEKTTYTINFGDAIQDLTEGNVPPNMRYVFSTGPVIDSLTFQAKLVDIFTKKPVEDALLMLYVNRADSVLYKSKPYYFAKSDTGGVVIIENIRPDTFKVVALKDENLNYKYDGETEQLSFLIDPLVVQGNGDIGTLELFLGEQPLDIRSRKSAYGKSTVYFNRKPYGLEYELLDDPPTIDYEQRALDSLMLWYQDTSKVDWKMVLRLDTMVIDTLLVKKSGLARPSMNSQFSADSKRKLLSFKSDTTLTYRWSQPISSIDSSNMTLSKDSISNLISASYRIDSINRHLLVVESIWEHPGDYLWKIEAGAVTDIFGVSNDSIGIIAVKADTDKSYAQVSINFAGLDSLRNYVVELLNRSEVVVKKGSVSVFENVLSFSLLDPGVYTIRLIEDNNANGRWDTGNYDEGRLPERIYIKVMPPLKANWEQTIDFNL